MATTYYLFYDITVFDIGRLETIHINNYKSQHIWIVGSFNVTKLYATYFVTFELFKLNTNYIFQHNSWNSI